MAAAAAVVLLTIRASSRLHEISPHATQIQAIYAIMCDAAPSLPVLGPELDCNGCCCSGGLLNHLGLIQADAPPAQPCEWCRKHLYAVSPLLSRMVTSAQNDYPSARQTRYQRSLVSDAGKNLQSTEEEV